LQLTGYVRGGCSPLGMKRKYRTFIDRCALDCEKIYISAGTRGEQIIIKPDDLIKTCDALVCDLAL
jgi:ybaK/ebsC protein